MAPVTVTLATQDFRLAGEVHIAQNAFHVGPEPQYTVLRSCVCAGFYHTASRTGAISHYTGQDISGPASIRRMIDGIEAGFRARGIELADCTCFLIGGSERCPAPFHQVQRELRRRNISFQTYDHLGLFQRKLRFDPETGQLRLFKKPGAETTGYYTPRETLQHFNDPASRIATGATVFFRNPELLAFLQDYVLPAATETGRLHIWCAGCSIGMEVYSIAMVALDWIKRHRAALEFRVLGSDISNDALDTARAGVYAVGKQVIDQYRPLMNAYMEPASPSTLRVGTELRRYALFKQRDIAEGSRRHLFELVVCDHVLQYFTETKQHEYIARLLHAVRPGFYAYISTPIAAVSRHIVSVHDCESVEKHFYRRTG